MENANHSAQSLGNALPMTRFLHEIPVSEVLAKKRWSPEDWIVYALDAMEHGGLGAVTIEELARRSKRTKGSFYAHFESRNELLEAMLEAWVEFKVAFVNNWDSARLRRGEFTLEGIFRSTKDAFKGSRRNTGLRRLNLEIAMREWARTDARAKAAVMRLDMQRLNNTTAMLLAEFPDVAHPQVFSLLFLWILYGRSIAFIDEKQSALTESWDLAVDAFVRMYRSTAPDFRVPGGPKWIGRFEPVAHNPQWEGEEPLPVSLPTAKPRKRRRR